MAVETVSVEGQGVDQTLTQANWEVLVHAQKLQSRICNEQWGSVEIHVIYKLHCYDFISFNTLRSVSSSLLQ